MQDQFINNKINHIELDGVITIFISVILICIISIVLVLTEGARMRASKLYYRIANNCAMDSMLSLYHLPLWENYHIFGLEYNNEEMLKDEFYSFLKVHSEDNDGSLIENWFPAILVKDKISLSVEQVIEKKNLLSEINDYTKLSLIGKGIDFLSKQIDIKNESDIENLSNILKSAFDNVASTSPNESKQLSKLTKEYNLEKELVSLNKLLTNISKTIKTANEQIKQLQGSRNYTSFLQHAKQVITNINSIYDSVNKFLVEIDITNNKLDKYYEKFETDKLSLSPDGIAIIEEHLSTYKKALDNCTNQNSVIDQIFDETDNLKNLLTGVIEEIEDFISSLSDMDSSEKADAKKEFNEYIKEVAEEIELLTYFNFDQNVNEEEKNKYLNILEIINNGFIDLILPKDNKISKSDVNYSYHDLSKLDDTTSLIDKSLINIYTFDHYNYYNRTLIDGNTPYSKSTRLEIEHLISSKNSDYDSIKECLNELFLIRSGMNLLYLYSSYEKRTEAFNIASIIAPAAPLLVPVIEASLLLVWASARAIIDLKNLLNCGKVPVIHTDETFALSLSGVINVFKNNFEVNDEHGLNYRDYLRILFYVKCLLYQKDIYTRMINLIEYNIKNNLPNEKHKQNNFNFTKLAYKINTKSTYKTKYIFSNLNIMSQFNLNKFDGTYELNFESSNSYENSILRGN